MKEKQTFNLILVSIALVIILVVGITFIALTNHINENSGETKEDRVVINIAPQSY